MARRDGAFTHCPWACNHGMLLECVKLQLLVPARTPARLITPHFCQECSGPVEEWRDIRQTFAEKPAGVSCKELLGSSGPQGQMGSSPKYLFSAYFWLECARNTQLWITSSRAASPCAPRDFGVCSAPAPLLGDGFAVVDLLGLGFPSWAHISELFWKEGRGGNISLPQGKEIINNSGVGTCLRPIPR